MTTIVFVCADIAGVLMNSHKLVVQPIFDLMRSQGYDCRWGKYSIPWGEVNGLNRGDVTCYVTPDTGIPTPELRAKTFFHPHGLHPIEKGIMSELWYGCLAPGPWWIWGIGSKKPCMPENKYAVTGWAKMDVLFKPGIREQTIAKYGLGDLPHQRTVLYAPAGNWDWSTSFDASALHILHMFEGLPYNLLVKTGDYCESFHEWGSFMNYISNAPKHIRHIPYMEDLSPLYLLSDVVITDGTSVMWEAIGLDKPTIQLNNMSDPGSSLAPGISDCEYCHLEDLSPHGEAMRGAMKKTFPECRVCGGTIKTSLNELRDTVVKAMDSPDEYVAERRKWASIVNSPLDGHAAERCVQAIKRMAGI